MRLDEVAPGLLLEMAYTRKRAETIIGGLEYQLNLHLLKLAAVPMPDQFGHWRQELTTWLATIAAIRLKPRISPGPAQWYFRLLFDEPFGGNEAAAVLARLQLLRQQYGAIRPDADAADLAARLQKFHTSFSQGCANGTMNLDQINALIAAF
jgi:hypothetical protein